MDADLTLGFAYLLDLAAGDPRWLPHPVRGLGWAIERGERLFRACVRNERLAGALLVTAVVLGAWVAVEAVLLAAAAWASWAHAAVQVGLFYICLSTRDLAVESWPVHDALRDGDIARARGSVRKIVGRDTAEMDEREVSRAAVETIAESTMDGIVAPLFYAVVGGVSLCCVYKAVNTLDSMVGYRSARYVRFGTAAATLDRWMNIPPAWITAVLLCAAGWLRGFSAAGGWRAALDPRVRRENSYLTEAALAGVLGVRCGGVNHYQGKPVETPFMGEERRPLVKERIGEAIRVMYTASALAVLLALAARFLWTGGFL